jgi:hypothetical protein
MKIISKLISSRKLIIFSITIMTVLITAGMSVVEPFSKPQPKAVEQSKSIQPTVSTNQPVVMIYSTPFGFEPEEVRFKPGEKIVMICNRSGLDALNYTITQPGQSPATNVKAALGENVFAQAPFSTGVATITESTHPDWVCKITVVP